MRFNTATRTNKPDTKNLAGAPAFKESSKLELMSILLTSFAKDQYYRKADNTFAELATLIAGQQDKLFVARAILYSRKVFGMRSITHVASAELSKNVKSVPWLRKFFSAVVHRPDDAIEIIAYYLGKYGKPIPNAMKRGLGSAIASFDEYQLAKYKAEGKEICLVDVVNLCHPVKTNALTKLIKGELKNVDTWESKLSKAGNDGETEEQVLELKGQAWETLLKENKLGYFALLRNLRNIMEQAPNSVELACSQLTDEIKIGKSLVLPFRFTTAIQEIQKLDNNRPVLKALNQALETACKNVPKFVGKTLIAVDTSGSMGNANDPKSYAGIASLFASVLFKSNESDILWFSSNAGYVKSNPDDTIATIREQIAKTAKSEGTNFNSIFQTANKNYDRVIILSDMQSWEGRNVPREAMNEYKKKYSADPKVFSFDLAGLGTLQFPEKNVFCLAGFSDKIFDVMKIIEQDKDALIHTIEKYEF